MSKILAFFLILLAAGILLFSEQPEGKYYDCSLSEISPDFPPQVREECRKLRSEAYKNGRI